MAIVPEPNSYLRSLSMEIQSKANRIRHLIGDAHFLTDGHHKEYVLQSMLEKFLPQGLICARGFVVRDQALSTISREQDLLLVDTRRCAPLFYESGVVVTFPENVRAAISVKSTLSSTSLLDSIRGLNSIPRIESEQQPWLGVFAFALDPDWGNKPTLAVNWVRERMSELFQGWTDGGICSNDMLYMRLNCREPHRVLGYATELSSALFLATLVHELLDRTDRSSRGIGDLMSSLEFPEIA
jgi:hypothetical protein